MANPSSSHHDRDRDRERERVVRERSHHHHRTISSTTLLLILSLVLAVLAVMLSLPSTRTPGASAATAVDSLRDSTTNGAGLLGSFFNPRRSEALVSREHSVAKRESEVAQREADILANALVTCGPYATVTEIVENFAPAPVQTIYREIINEKEVAVTVPAPPQPTENTAELTRRIEELIQRETKVAEREKDMGRREEAVNRREHDAQRRESWIMEQLIALGNDPQVIEEEYTIIDQPPSGKRKVKALPSSEKTVTHTETLSVRVPPASNTSPSPASTRPAEFPLPVSFTLPPEPASIPTHVYEVIVEDAPELGLELEEEDDEEETVTIRRSVRPTTRRRLW